MPIHVRCAQNTAPIVFLPGDPNRAKWIAENVFEDAVCTTSYRQMLGYTGRVGETTVSVQTTGMGGPSAAVVCEELVTLGAKFFIRIGTCGALDPGMNPGDLFIVTAACMADGTSNEIVDDHMRGTTIPRLGFAATSDFHFLRAAYDEATEQKIPFHMGKVASLDRFYGHDDGTYRRLVDLGIGAVEMEAATVLTTAAKYGVRAAAMMAVSDQVFGAKRADEETIQHGVERMIRVAVRAARKVV